ncbi:phosphotransferase [Mycobacterium sp. CBMA293]|uniref:phosphotransferase enzyme family protein n=1 Tax=unclassified Mycolicibacterium TaxID=2636767 RepID=UPI0012DEA80C|nr:MULTISPECIES: phosphotransferase [unclassified Mycolicibacterium]MUL49322.1 phosphotransferase [Mycolicibacterium sp. CBMA 360]MUL58981.1 phosphotransferase [Mycolicibacterium sp. CBMA 335]MUL69375.1 phosphotransferase [Mycolicibacterium sp. CBMA 311]MUL94339.1 phosphotransferase [Mycolicibacterium sp. CBMA 230]MUM06647.1 aminoglycoside phosphotransferase [Mycolicibacterium sp. CBMA 213]
MSDMAAADYERFARAALPHYNLGSATVTLLSFSENGTFLVDDGGERVVLRVHRPGYHSLAAIESELDWMESLRLTSSITTPQVIPAPDGRRVVEARVGDETCLVDLFTFVEGTIAEDDASDISFSELGAITAALHDHVQQWQRPEAFTRFSWDLETMLGPAGRWGNWRHAPALSADDAAIIEEAERKVIDRLTDYGMGPERFGLVHADLRMSNLMVHQGKITVIDFDDCGWSWYLTDLGAVVSFIEESPDAPRIIDEWLEGYRSVRDIPAADLAEIPTFVMLRRLMLTAWIGTHPESSPAQTLGHRYASGTAQLAQAYLTDPSWFRVDVPATAHTLAH